MTSVVIPYHSNAHGLAVTLVALQSQLVPPDSIVVIDTSKDGSGLALCRRYATHDVPIVVESAKVGIYEAWNKGIELSGPDADCIVLNDDLLFPQNLIDVMTSVRALAPGLVFVPNTPPRQHAAPTVTLPFAWYADVYANISYTDWMPGFCFLLTAECIQEVGGFDEHFKVWFGDTDYEQRLIDHLGSDRPVVRIDSLFVYHYGGTSYDYRDKKVQGQIQKDRAYYEQKHPFH